MIPLAQIIQWRQFAPWPDDMQVEQDLILSRIIIEIFSDPFLGKELAFRGGTALHKLFFEPAARYSEDIDLVRTSKGEIGPIVDALRKRLDPWLGEPKRQEKDMNFKLLYSFTAETSSATRLRVKIEINKREISPAFDYYMKSFSVQSDWFTGEAQVKTFQFEELLATKLRALYQRRKGRDLFDLWLALKSSDLEIPKIIKAFQHYLQEENNQIKQLHFIENLLDKLEEPSFVDDIDSLLSLQLSKRQSKNLITENGSYLIFHEGKKISTAGWSVLDAAVEVRDRILAELPE